MNEAADPVAPDAPAGKGARGVARQSLGLLVANVAGSAGFFISALLLARSLGPSGRGVMAFFVVSALVGSRLVSPGLGDATSVAAARYPERRSVVLGNAVFLGAAMGLLGGGLLVGVLALVEQRLPKGIDGTVLALLEVGIVANTVSAGATGFLRGSQIFRAYGRIVAVAPWLYVLGLALLWIGPGIDVPRAAAAWVGYAAFAAIASLVAAVRVNGISRPERDLAREAMAFGVRAWVGSLAGILNARVDQIIMGFITTEAVLGVYSVAVNVSEVLLYLPNATSSALLPAILQSAPEHRVAQTLAVFRRLTVVTAAGALAAAAIGAPLIPVVFGPAFHDSAVPFLILLPGALGYAALTVAEAALLAVGLPLQASLTMVVALAVGVALDFLLVPAFGASGASAAASAAFLTSGLTAIALFRRSNTFPWKEVVPGWGDVTAVIRGARSAIRPVAPSGPNASTS